MYSKPLKNLLKKGTKRNVLIMIAGTAASQVIPLLMTPFITRVYSPSDFGILALFMSLVGIFSTIATGTYEQAIVWAKTNNEAKQLAFISISLTSISCVLLSSLIILTQYTDRLHGIQHIGFLVALPVAIWLNAILNVILQWKNYLKSFKDISLGKTIQSATSSSLQLIFGILHLGWHGLIYGFITGSAFSIMYLLKVNNVIIKKIKAKFLIKIRELKFVAYENQRYPRFMLAGQLCNSLSSNLPVLIIGFLYSTEAAGAYAIAAKVLGAPIMIIGSAIGDVYKREARDLYVSSGNWLPLFKKTFGFLIIGATIIFLPFLFFGPALFRTLFGNDWSEAGEIASILAIMSIFQSVSTPLAPTILLANLQKFDMFWQITRVIFAALSLFIGHYLFDNYFVSIILYAASFSILFLFHLIIQFKAAEGVLKS
jgi:O-antigen/teichoic acid export membrane protein